MVQWNIMYLKKEKRRKEKKNKTILLEFRALMISKKNKVKTSVSLYHLWEK